MVSALAPRVRTMPGIGVAVSSLPGQPVSGRRPGTDAAQAGSVGHG